MGIAALCIVMAVTLLIGVPIGASLLLSCIALVLVQPVTTMEFLAQSMYSSVSSFTLICLPFFMLCGSIMDTGGISEKLVRFAKSLVGNITGGLGIVSVIACMFFGAISGSAPATVVAIGTIMIPQMVKAGYDKYYSTALLAVAGGLGIIVPPSYPMVLYGATNNVSIGDLFMAGVGPALVIGLLLILFNCYYSRKYGYRGDGTKFSLKEVFVTLWDAKLALLMPVIILGGIYGGIFTATEAAVVACVYGIVVGMFVYKKLTLKGLWKMLMDNVVFCGGIMFTIAMAGPLGAIFAYCKVPAAIKGFFLGITTNPYLILFFIFLLLFVVGMFIQTTPAIVILSPILLPIVRSVGIDPVHYGIITVVALALGFVTPPVGINLFVASSMTGLGISKIVKYCVPLIFIMIIAFFIIAYVPAISLFILSL